MASASRNRLDVGAGQRGQPLAEAGARSEPVTRGEGAVLGRGGRLPCQAGGGVCQVHQAVSMLRCCPLRLWANSQLREVQDPGDALQWDMGRMATPGAQAHRAQGWSLSKDPETKELRNRRMFKLALVRNSDLGAGSDPRGRSAPAPSPPSASRSRSPRHNRGGQATRLGARVPRMALAGSRRLAPEDVAPLQRPCACRSLVPPPPLL